jgi:integrase
MENSIMRGCRPLTGREIVKVTHAFHGRHSKRDRAFFVLGLKTGLRCRELLGLRLGDVWDGKVLKRIYVRRSITKGKRTGFAIPLHPVAAKVLDDFVRSEFAKASPDMPLFFSGQKQSGKTRSLDRSSAWRILKRAYRRAGLQGNTGCHSMRKTFCQNVYRVLNNDLIATQAAMHHSSITSTIRYLTFDNNRVEAAILAA